MEEVGSFIVVERDACLIACGALIPFHDDKCAEIAALAVASECRGLGQGDKLLGRHNNHHNIYIVDLNICGRIDFFYLMVDYMENKALKMGLERLFLLTTRTADWY